ncbi:adenylate/guanylate cyclase domain-containing protein [Larkinella sp. C7]|uniref:adenylate/guanylate cyclase domain-containing protein n=1 Tax=Larkinella sp. C7 TaxID=2576607 RepID=UPI0011110006|nr:adenylate/guanylate cyclase domain-containing protein [Larkinella sp. C7]
MNLALSQELRRQYGEGYQKSEEVRALLSENIESIIQEVRARPNNNIKVKLNESFNARLGTPNNNLSNYLLNSKTAELVLLFIDICSFSTKFSSLNNQQLTSYLDSYYKIVLPIIYKYQGEIDKIMGDGIICLFGPPFLNTTYNDRLRKAEDCAKEIIAATNGTSYSLKIALHPGQCMYYHNTSLNYPDFTIIGKCITELYRLESIAEDEKIIFFSGTKFESETLTRHTNFTRPWYISNQASFPSLKGVTGYNWKRTLIKT